MNHYRIIISYSDAQNVFSAKAPELPGCEALGGTRSEAIAKLEEEMAAQVENIKSQGLELPTPIDEQEFAGELNLKITPALHRDLAFLAKIESVEMENLLTELLTRGVNMRWGNKGRPRGENRSGRMQEGHGQRYHEIMENRADFIEYVRSLETSGGGHRSGSGPHAGGRGGRHSKR